MTGTNQPCPIVRVCSENQQFLKDIVTSVHEGQGVGWLKMSRLKKLMEDENYRNFVGSRLNTSLDKKLSDDDIHIEDVVSGILSALFQSIRRDPCQSFVFVRFTARTPVLL